MSTTPDAIDQLFSFTLNGIAYTVEIIGKNAPQIAKFFMGLTHQGVRTKGEIKLHNLLRRGAGLEALNIREQDFPAFQKAAKKSGLLFSTVCMDEKSPKGERVFTVYFSEADMALVNNLLGITRINTVKAAEFRTVAEQAAENSPPQPEAQEEEGRGIDQFVGEDGEYVKPSDLEREPYALPGQEPLGLPENAVIYQQESVVISLPEQAEGMERVIPTMPGSGNGSPSAASSGLYGREEARPETANPETALPMGNSPASLPMGTSSQVRAVVDFRRVSPVRPHGPGRGPALSMREQLARQHSISREQARKARAGAEKEGPAKGTER